MKHLLLAFLLLGAPGVAMAQASGPPHIDHEADYVKAVIGYVRDSRGWPDNAYTVRFYARDGDDLVFAVDYGRGDSASNLVVGEGDSFKVLVNGKTRKVEREMYFG